jgi:hypothetical protein
VSSAVDLSDLGLASQGQARASDSLVITEKILGCSAPTTPDRVAGVVTPGWTGRVGLVCDL